MSPYELYELLLRPLEQVKQNPKYHPEGDALYHSLQVFELARQARPWDQEFVLAAILHDVIEDTPIAKEELAAEDITGDTTECPGEHS